MLRNARGARATTTNAGTTKPSENARRETQSLAARFPKQSYRASDGVDTGGCALDSSRSPGRKPRDEASQSRHPNRPQREHERGTGRSRRRESTNGRARRPARNRGTPRPTGPGGEVNVAEAASDQHRTGPLSRVLPPLQDTWMNAVFGGDRDGRGRRLGFQASMERVGYDPCLLPKLPAAFHSRRGAVHRYLPRVRWDS